MSESKKPDLSLGEPPGKLKSMRSNGSTFWISCWLILQTLVLGAVLVFLLRGGRAESPDTGSGGVDPRALRELALELENRSLAGQAAQAWQQYLDEAGELDERAEILYRMGRLYMQAEQFDHAAVAFVQAEQHSGGDPEMAAKVGPKMVTCLGRLGLYGEVGRELSRRVEQGAEDTEKGQVLATFAGEQFTQADLDRMIERRVDQMLGASGSVPDQSTREAMLRQFAQPETRMQLLQEFLRSQLFARRARELKLDQQEDFQNTRRDLEEDLLAQRFQQRELNKIQPTDVDLEAFYQANSQRYRQPDSLQAIVLQLKPDEEVDPILDQIDSPDDFEQLVESRQESNDENSPDLVPVTLVRDRPHPQLGDTSELFELAEGKWTTEPHVHDEDRFLVLIRSKSPGGVPPLNEIRAQVQNDYVMRKRQELSEQLMRDLMQRYDVKIVPAENIPSASSETKQDGE